MSQCFCRANITSTKKKIKKIRIAARKPKLEAESL